MRYEEMKPEEIVDLMDRVIHLKDCQDCEIKNYCDDSLRCNETILRYLRKPSHKKPRFMTFKSREEFIEAINNFEHDFCTCEDCHDCKYSNYNSDCKNCETAWLAEEIEVEDEIN